jgi:hypothetical protein
VKVSFPRIMAGQAVGLARTETQATLFGFGSFALLVAIFGFQAYRRRGPRLPVRRQTHPGMELPSASVLLHRTSPGWDRVFPATLFDLADRGVVTLERVDRKKGIITSQKVLLHRSDDGDEPLTPFETALLSELEQHETLEDFASKGKKFRKRAMEEVQAHLIETDLLVDIGRSANRAMLYAASTAALTVALFVTGAVGGNPWLMATVGPGLGLALGLALIGSVRAARSRRGAEALATLEGYLQGVRDELKQKTKVSPIGAAEFMFGALPWLTLDPKYYGTEGRKIAQRLKKETGPLRAIPWAVDRTKAYEKIAAKHSAAHAAFIPVLHVTGATSGAVAPSAGGGVGGAAGAGAAGGGGGGAG